MGTISSGTGLVSGIDYKSLVDQLMQIESQPRTTLATRQTEVNAQRTAVMDIASQLMSLRSMISSLRTSNSLSAAKATSSNTDILAATAANGAVPGAYQFKVAQLVATQQLLSTGYADTDSTTLSAGTMVFQSSQARLTDSARLDLLNGQQGVRRGSIRITDRSGASAVIDLSTAVTAGDVLDAINNNTTLQVHATTDGGKIVLADQTGLALANLSVREVGQGHTAADLGILQSVAADTFTGSDLVVVNSNTKLSLLNQGLGVQNKAGDDFQIALRDGTTFSVAMDGAATLGGVVDAINAASHSSANPDALVASINAAGDGIKLVDSSTGGSLAVTALNSSGAAYDLGILGSDTAGDGLITGHALLGGLQSVLLDRLNGGAGVGRGSISITDRDGVASVVDLSSAQTIQDVMAAINAGGVTADVTAALNASGNGLVITDNSGGAGNLIIADVGGATTAADLKITVDAAASEVASGDLNRQFVGLGTRLADLAFGQGVSKGKFTITNSAGASATVDLTAGTVETLADVVTAINAAGLSVTASINSTGDGLLIQDAAGGAGLLTIADTSGTSARDLKISGAAAAGHTYIDGSSEVSIAVLGTDTLSSLVDKINASGAAVTAGIVNDGSPTEPYRLSLVARNSGAAGAVLVDAGATGLGLSELVAGADAVLTVGQGGAGQPLLITQNSNTVTGVVDHVTLDLLGADPSRTVNVSVTNDSSGVLNSLKGLVNAFNTVTGKIATYTKFDTETMKGAVLQGDTGLITAQSRLYSMIFTRFQTDGAYQTLSSIGFSIGSGGQLSLDEAKFNAAFAAHPDEVRTLLTDSTSGALPAMQGTLDALAASGTGSLAVEADRLGNQYDMYQTRLDSMDKLLELKRARLTDTFNKMEQAIATLQSQQSAITNLANLVTSFTNSVSSSKSK